MKTLKNKINEALVTLYDKDNVNEFIDALKKGINAVYVVGDVGFDPNEPYVIMTVSLDEEKDWSQGYVINSRYFKFAIDVDGSFEMIVRSSKQKMRKFKAKNVETVIKKVNDYIKIFDN